MSGGERAPEALLGRDRELRVLRALAEDPVRGGVAVVHGPAGIGKSALLAAAGRGARARGFGVLRTAGVSSEASLPYGALERLLRDRLDATGALAAPQRDALLSALGRSDHAVSDVFLVGLATLNLLAGAAAGRRLVVVVDDAHWLDPASADVLGFVGRRIEAEPVALLIGRRDGAAAPWLEHLEPARPVDVELGPLDDAASRALLEQTANGLPTAARRRMLTLARGNPLALVELPRSPAPGPAGAHGGARLTQRLERAFGAQAAGLPPSTRALLRVVAAEDSGVTAEILAAARRLEPAVGGRDVDAAVAAGLLEPEDGRLRFRHPLMRSAIAQAARPDERRAAHAAIAEAAVDDPHARAWHRAAAASGPDDAIAADLEAAAADARRRGAVASAARGLQRAAALTTARDEAVRRLLGAAELLADLGHVDGVERLLGRAEGLDGHGSASGRIHLLREVYADDVTDDAAPVRLLLAEAASARADGDDALALKLLLAAGTRCWWALPADAPVREDVVDEALRVGVAEHDARLLAVLASASAVRHGALLADRLERACADPAAPPADLHLLGQAAHMAGHAEQAVRQLARAEGRWRAQGRLALLAQALVMRAWSSIQLGNWPAVEPAAQEGERLACETAQPLWAAGARSALSAAAGARGDDPRARALAANVEAQLVTTRPANLLAVLQVARGVTALGAGRFTEAYETLARMFDPTDPAHHYAERHGGLSYLAEAALHAGRTEEARGIVARFAGVADANPVTLVQVGVGVGRALVSEPGDAEAAFQQALASRAARLPFHRARLLLAYGGWLRRSRRPAESRGPLRTARDLFDALGTVPWGERAREELRASGETSRRRVPEARDELTPQELQIAHLAATGLSNPEIGERLFLSPRTVASHLYRAFPKLGVTSRRELSLVLARAAEAN